MENELHCLMVFVDGLGIGDENPTLNPIQPETAPTLHRLIKDHAVPVDACLGMEGLPQSATGQAALLTGQNAAAILGRHMQGFPGPTVKKVVVEHNLFDRLRERGYDATFANGYYLECVTPEQMARRQSVTTVATLKAFGKVRDSAKILANRAVCQDLTRKFIRSKGFPGPAVTPEESAEHLCALAEDHHFTLFEFFQTDLAAHKGTREEIEAVLHRLDTFLAAVQSYAEREHRLLIIISDHGNIEDLTTRSHTRNPVPLVALGEGQAHMRERVRSLTDFTPALLELFPARKTGEPSAPVMTA